MLQEKLDSFLAGSQKIMDDYYTKFFPNNPREFLVIAKGKKYAKIVRKQVDQPMSGSAHCFVDLTNGDVLKAASWASPAKHARGNIYDEHNGLKYISAYGPAYLK